MQGVVVPLEVHVGRGGEHQRPRQAKVGEEHLPHLLVNHFPLFVFRPHLHVAQGQPLHLLTAGVGGLQRHQGAPHRDDFMPRLLGQPIAVPSGASARIGGPSGGQDDAARLQALGAVLGGHPHHLAVLELQARDPVPAQLHTQATQLKKQGVDDVGGLVRNGKDPVAPLHLQLDPQAPEKVHGGLGIKPGQGAIQELAVAGNGGHQLFRGTVIGDVAPPLSGDVQLAPHLLIGLHQHHLGPASGGRNGRHHSGSSRPHHNYTFSTHRRSIPLPGVFDYFPSYSTFSYT